MELLGHIEHILFRCCQSLPKLHQLPAYQQYITVRLLHNISNLVCLSILIGVS